MKYISIALIAILFSCCNSQPTIEDIAKKYMTDSIVPRFNDPASYEYVSTKVDTFRGADLLNNLKRRYANIDTLLIPLYADERRQFDSLSLINGYADSLLHLNIEIAYRGKNKMGALILDKTELRYFPKENRITEVR